MPSAPRLSAEDIDTAVALLNGWTGKLTWKIFLPRLALELESAHVYSKVAMLKQLKIQRAWKQANERLRQEAESVGAKSHGTSAIATLRRMLDEARAEVADLRALDLEHIERFKRWQYNAERLGVTRTQLDAPLLTKTTSK